VRHVEGERAIVSGVWDRSTTPEGEDILSSAVITLPANELMREIHNAKHRMPAILAPEDVEVWLTGSGAEGKGTAAA
jgi:putative SOS response-associated peptidase YedK